MSNKIDGKKRQTGGVFGRLWISLVPNEKSRLMAYSQWETSVYNLEKGLTVELNRRGVV